MDEYNASIDTSVYIISSKDIVSGHDLLTDDEITASRNVVKDDIVPN
jgi:hypothetical protein